MTINFESDNLFDTDAEAIVNTVNCVGVMGKGVALEFKKRWPENYKAYKKACDSGTLRPGKLLVFDRRSLLSSPLPRFLINFPTKDHWRSKSKIEYITEGLDRLAEEIERHGISSIAIPPLGCGNGGLEWIEVRPIIVAKLSHLTDVTIHIHGPAPARADEIPETVHFDSRLTSARAIYLRTIAALEERTQEPIDRLSLHKIAYLLQEFGVSFNIGFSNSLHGPYSRKMSRAISVMIGWKMLAATNELSRSRRVRVTGAGFAAADEFIKKNQPDELPIENLLDFISGFETPRRLELLTSTLYSLLSSAAGTMVEPTAPSRSTSFSAAEIDEALRRISSTNFGDHLVNSIRQK